MRPEHCQCSSILECNAGETQGMAQLQEDIVQKNGASDTKHSTAAKKSVSNAITKDQRGKDDHKFR